MRALARMTAAVVISVMALAASSAWAAGSSDLAVDSVDGRTVQLIMTFDPTEATSPIAEATATVAIAGTQLPAEVRPIEKDQAPVLAVLVLDASGSMTGSRMKTAKKAAANFVDALPDGALVALVAFNDTIQVVTEPTADRAQLLDGLEAIEPGGDTALYDAVEKALTLAPEGTRARAVVLSDGKDTSSTASLSDVTASAEAAGVPIDVIALRPTADELQTLREVSGASGGQVRTASTSADLLAAFNSASQAFGSQVYLVVDVPPTLDASGKPVTASLDAGASVMTASARLPVTPSLEAAGPSPTTGMSGLGTAGVATVTDPLQPPRGWAPSLMALVVAVTVAAIVLLVMRVRQRTVARRRIDQVLAYQVGSGSGTNSAAASASHGVMAQLDAALARTPGYRKTRNGLAAAGVSYTPASWLLIRLAIVAVLMVAFTFLLGSILAGILAGGVFGWFMTRMWLSSRAAKRRTVFGDELPDFLTLLASGLRAGLSFNSALESAAADGKGEVGKQIRRALSEVQLGAQLDKALLDCADRMDNEDLRWAVLAMSIQREVGGNLSTILERVAATIRARHELSREVRTLTAEGKLSAYVLVALPLGVFAFLFLFRREYVAVLWTDPLGMIMLGAIVVLMVLGWLWMRSLVRIKV